jgi:hypothetical protein
MSSSKKIISNRLLHNQYAVLLDKTDDVTVSKVAKLSLNKPFVQTMTLGEAVRYGAWDTENGTMSVEVQFRGAEIFKSPNNQYWAIISVLSNPRGQTCRELMSSQIEETAAARRAAAASERETVYFGYGF